VRDQPIIPVIGASHRAPSAVSPERMMQNCACSSTKKLSLPTRSPSPRGRMASRVDPDGYPRLSRDAMRARGLGDIVGSDRFFVELHAQFCIILSGLTALGVR